MITMEEVIIAYENCNITEKDVMDWAWSNPDITSEEVSELKGLINEDFISESEREAFAELGEGTIDMLDWPTEEHGLDPHSYNGREWIRHQIDEVNSQEVPIFDRVQESGEIQGDLQDDGSGFITWEASPDSIFEDEQ